MAEKTVTLTIDGKSVTAATGTNIIQAAKQLGIEIPFYCYHKHLSVPGNCRICQVEVVGMPKLMVACHTQVQDGMEVKTHATSEKVQAAQAATMEFILINHPLDCTVCDQSGHCKLQDYHFEYNAKPSRFLEEKVRKVKAEPLGPTVILDGERCIMCTRCIRFCDEITKTSELGMLNRGDRSVIAVHEGKQLDNPLSGTVVDLCPVGALTHRNWRFNTRIWYTKETDSICPGCSTGCNVKVAVRDKQVVQVKARMSDEVNKEWLCDEGRYGFNRFLPKTRITETLLNGQTSENSNVQEYLKNLKTGKTLLVLAPDLLLEEYVFAKAFLKILGEGSEICLAYRERTLSEVEAILVSPDYAANFKGAEFAGAASGNLESNYTNALARLHGGDFENVVFLGDRAVVKDEQSEELCNTVAQAKTSVGIFCDESLPLASAAALVFPARSILEKSGLLINRQERLQFAASLLDYPAGTFTEWQALNNIADVLGQKLTDVKNDREMTRAYLKSEPRLSSLSIAKIKQGGISLHDLPKQKTKETNTGVSAPAA